MEQPPTPSSPELPTYRSSGDVAADKITWRALVRAARRELVDGWEEGRREELARSLAASGVDLMRRYAVSQDRADLTGLCVTAFEPMRTEPPVDGLTRALQELGVRVLVPITLERPRLGWADLADPDRTPLGEEVLTGVDLFLVPALAISRAGVRLGQGGGYYDWTLPRARALSGGAPVVACVHDHEVLPEVPADGHDAIADLVLRPTLGVDEVPLA
ncbi:5-formyltetrahydrofolate cyclo-ligase [Ornithinimicrobium sp. Y1847]|uniref:5-formyltetrahydrofolate cyclo-ligase n=1 Tax=Ornithinimicrobium sp. Y1847 TaxID=3405419 RepID=UPI003B670ABC